MRLHASWPGVVVALLMGFASAWSSAAAATSGIEWRKGPYIYVASDKPLYEVIRDFAGYQGLSVVIDKRIDERVSVHFWHPPPEVLRILTRSHGVTAFQEGRVLHFFRTTDIATRIVKIRGASMDRVRSSLRRLGMEDARFPLTFDDVSKVVVIQGPQSYVDTLTEAVQSLDEGKGDSIRTEEIRVFPLRFAWAQDKTIANTGESVTLPGVATVLKRLFQGHPEGAAPKPESLNKAGRSATLTPGKLVSSALLGNVEVPPTFEEVTKRFREDRAETREGSARRSDLPQIEADGQLNAVIVRDVAYRMDWYTKVIAALDVKPLRVEIEARILDVEATSLDQLGIRWQAVGNRVTAGFNGAPIAGAAPAFGSTTVTTIIGNARNVLLMNLSALEQKGQARVIAQPKVLTLNNVEATLSNMETYYVKVAGNLSAELFNVSAGTRLRVTPLVSTEADGTRIVKLALSAQDGDFSTTSVDQLPIVKTRDIATQALIREGESLLVGGMVYEREGKVVAGVPVLSHVPGVGRFFQHTERTRSRVERLFLITPRIVEDSTVAGRVQLEPVAPEAASAEAPASEGVH